MFIRLALFCCLLAPGTVVAESEFLSSLANTPRYSMVALSYGEDFQHLNGRGESYEELTFSGGRFPRASGFGWQVYLMGAKVQEKGRSAHENVLTMGWEALYSRQIFTSSFFIYGGVGLAYSDQKTSVTGTLWNFSTSAGIRYRPDDSAWFIDTNYRHLSHGSKFGIEEDKPNDGINVLGMQMGIAF